jgi:hypothetical protein
MASLEESWISILSDSVTKDLCDELIEKGWATKDNVLGEKALKLIDEVRVLSSMENGFKQHNFQFGASASSNASASAGEASKIFRKPNIFEVDMHDSHVKNLPIPQFKELFASQSIQKSFSKHLPHLGLINSEATLKIQRNTGNGMFSCFFFFFHWARGGGG